jgi:hypothetical protein
MKRSQSTWAILSAPIILPLLAYLVLSSLGMGETYPPRKPSRRTITMAELDQQQAEWQQQLSERFDRVPVMRQVWDPPTLSYVWRPEMKLVPKV